MLGPHYHAFFTENNDPKPNVFTKIMHLEVWDAILKKYPKMLVRKKCRFPKKLFDNTFLCFPRPFGPTWACRKSYRYRKIFFKKTPFDTFPEIK